MEMDSGIIYYERANGRWEYWFYIYGFRLSISAAKALREVRRGNARLVEVK